MNDKELEQKYRKATKNLANNLIKLLGEIEKTHAEYKDRDRKKYFRAIVGSRYNIIDIRDTSTRYKLDMSRELSTALNYRLQKLLPLLAKKEFVKGDYDREFKAVNNDVCRMCDIMLHAKQWQKLKSHENMFTPILKGIGNILLTVTVVGPALRGLFLGSRHMFFRTNTRATNLVKDTIAALNDSIEPIKKDITEPSRDYEEFPAYKYTSIGKRAQ